MKLTHISLAVAAMAAWGFNFVAISVGLQDMPPFLFAALRFVLTVFPFIFFVRKPDVSWQLIFGVGLFMLTLQFTFLYKGMAMGVGGGITSAVAQVQVFFTMIMGAIILRERPGGLVLSGLAVAVLGIVLIGLTMVGAGAGDQSSIGGLMMVVLAGFFWSIGNILLKKCGKIDMLSMVIYASLVPPIPLFALSYFVEGPAAISLAFASISWATVAAFTYIVLISTLFSYTVWGFLLKNYQSGQVVPFALLVPIFGVFSGWMFLGESFGPQRLIGAGLVVLGLVIVNWRSLWLQKT